MPWKPGQSGNPAGRRAKGVRAAARRHTKAALAVLADIAGDPRDAAKPGSKDDKARASAANSLLQWGHGKPDAPMLSEYSDNELRAEVQRRANMERAREDVEGPGPEAH